jgi:hypothetical protein
MVTKTRFASADKAAGPQPDANGKHARRSTDGAWSAMQHALGALGRRLPEMRQDLSCYTAVQVDRLRLAGANLVTSVATRVLQLLAAAAVLTVAVYLLMAGVAGGVATALQGKVWLANVITGAGTLTVLAPPVAAALPRPRPLFERNRNRGRPRCQVNESSWLSRRPTPRPDCARRRARCLTSCSPRCGSDRW